MSDLPVSMASDHKSIEKVIKRFDVLLPAASRRKDPTFNVLAVTVIFSAMLFGLVLISRVQLHLFNMVQLLVICAVFWKIFQRASKFLAPDITELLVTNHRLVLRAGADYSEWVSAGDCDIEVRFLSDIAGFALRPIGQALSPPEVYVKSDSPLQDGRELADLLRSMREKSLLEERNSAYAASRANRADSLNGSAVGVSIPPGIIVTHAFLCNQLRSIVAAIPLLSFVEAEQIVSQYRLAPLQASALPSAVFSANPSASEITESSSESDVSLDLGATGYQFGVDQQP